MQFSSLYIALVTAVTSTQVLGSAQNNFGASCSGMNLASGHICEDGHGGTPTTSVDLDQCVSNIGGTLECQIDGEFAQSCSDCALESGTILSCNCRNDAGSVGNTLKNLGKSPSFLLLRRYFVDVSDAKDDCVSNTNGQLTCP
ncbi:hypothetical protein OF83DRAFT_1170784 [Amylostereum chailletii]|nr:hypothetical protein OF83DRAFT_1170784 [Amylostereum chailletii]